jgi:hypothetical protein
MTLCAKCTIISNNTPKPKPRLAREALGFSHRFHVNRVVRLR